MTVETVQLPICSAWDVLRGPISPTVLDLGATDIAARHHLRVNQLDQGTLLLTDADGAARVTVRWHPYAPERPDTLSHVLPDQECLEILLDVHPGGQEAAGDLQVWLRERLRCYDPAELAQITASMPLLAGHAVPDKDLAGWAVIFRDHYVENSLAFLMALQEAGVPPQWIYALSKGDRTRNRDRVHATLLAQGCTSGLLDNTTINAPETHADDLARAMDGVDAFIDAAHEAQRPVLVIDDGGLLAQGYGRADAPRRVDAAVELTVSGLKRITAAGPLSIPVFNLARSELKTYLGYPEIADSCLRRLRELLPAVKVIGRPVLVLGYGTLGSRLANALRAQGCQVNVVDPDPLALIGAAENGHTTYRTAVDALLAMRPFLVVATTGEVDALTEEAVSLLPDEIVMAPYATKDFELLTTDPELARAAVEIPGIGRRYRLRSGAWATILGDGRSMNLFESDSIPNQGYDAYRAGTLIAAKELCAQVGTLQAGVHTELVDEIISASGLYDAYYDTYLAFTGAPARSTPARPAPLAGVAACVVGYGTVGRLHAQILTEAGAELTIVDPKHQDLPRTCQTFRHGVDDLPATVSAGVGMWSVCCPTADHLPVLRSILTHDPQARILLEKPACQGHEIDALIGLLEEHPNARIVITDQYQHARALDVVTDLISAYEPGASASHIEVTFTKDRSADIAGGRFVDRSYGVLGYEWLHMLAVLRRLIPAEVFDAYLTAHPKQAMLRAIYDPRLFVSALTEHSTLRTGDHLLHLELHSSITSSAVVLGGAPEQTAAGWRRDIRPADDRHRYLTVHAGRTRVTVHLDPVTAAGGWQLERNHHRVTVERDGDVLHDQVVEDSPLHTAIELAAGALISSRVLPPLDLGPLRRITAMAEHLRAQQPHQETTPGSDDVVPTSLKGLVSTG